jgi:hypothetical protein
MEDESPLDVINEELHELRRKTEALWQRSEAQQEVLEALSAMLLRHPKASLHWAKTLEEIAAKRELFDENDFALPWLRSFIEQMRDAHDVLSVTIITADGAKLRPLSRRERRERLSVLHGGGLQTPAAPAPAPHAPPAFPETAAPDEACGPSLPEAP